MLAVCRGRPAAIRLLSNGSRPPAKRRPKLALNITQQDELINEPGPGPIAPPNPLEDEFFRIEKKFPRRIPGWDQVELKLHPSSESDAEKLKTAFNNIRDTLEECGHFHDKQKQVMMQLASKLLSQDFSQARTSWD